MSAKIITSLKDENPNLQKQIGCMNGIFQLFDRHHLLTSRRPRGHNHKKLLPGPSHNVELTGARPATVERNGKVFVNEKHRISIESSRTSTSSSFSSLDHNTTAQQEPIASIRHSFTEPLSQTIPTKPQNSSLPPGRQSTDLRDVVKDSMYREARGLAIKTVAKEEGRSYVMKHIDSPRPLQQPIPGQPRVTGVNGSSRGKHHEALKDSPRFSYDGRELRDAAKSSTRLKELPRLSLDSRDTRSPASQLRSNCLLTDLRREKGNARQILNLGQEPSSNRSSSVIAKLMGLEAIPDHAPTDQAKLIVPDEYLTSRSPHKAQESRKNQVPLSPRVLQKDPGYPQPSKTSLVRKQTSSSRFPVEQAPWRQPDTSRGSHNLAVKSREALADAPHASSTVYGEIEKRIAELEFKQSGKDLRALKHTLDAMQKTRQRLENQNAEEADCESQTSRCTHEYSDCPQDSRSIIWQNQQTNPLVPSIKGTSPPKRTESSIVIMKPVKLVDKFRNSSSPPVSATDVQHVQKLQTQDAKYKRVDSVDKRIPREQLPRNSNLQEPSRRFPSVDKKNKGQISRAIQISRETKHAKGEYHTSPAKSSGTVSPRSRLQKRDIDKQNHPNTPSSDLHRARMQSSKINVDSGSPNRKLKVKSVNSQRGDDQISKLYSERRKCYHQDDTVSSLSESNNSLASRLDSEVTSTDQSENDSKQHGDSKDKDPSLKFSEDMPIAKLSIAVLEQPSPISVLDATFYGEDSPSPMKKISTAFTDDESLDADEAVWHAETLDNWQKIRKPNLGFECTNDKLENIKDLVHKLKLLNPMPDEATTDYSASLRDRPNPDHQYITKILLSSGLLKDVSSISTPIQLHSSGHLINPNLFHVLEQTEGRTEVLEDEVIGKTIQLKVNQKIHRKILFNTVNEILVRKLSSDSILLRRNLNGQELLKEIYSEVDFLQTISDRSVDDEDDQLVSILNADMTRQSEDWAAYSGEVPALVLDIERLIFKDLISEVINDEIAGHENWPRRPCRQLFTK